MNPNVPTDPTRLKAFPLDLDQHPPRLKKSWHIGTFGANNKKSWYMREDGMYQIIKPMYQNPYIECTMYRVLIPEDGWSLGQAENPRLLLFLLSLLLSGTARTKTNEQRSPPETHMTCASRNGNRRSNTFAKKMM